MVAGIYDQIEAAPTLHGWDFFSGISPAYASHGYCAPDPWVVRIGESLESQADISGWVHPGRSGHDAYADAIGAHYYVPEPSFGLRRKHRIESVQLFPRTALPVGWVVMTFEEDDLFGVEQTRALAGWFDFHRDD
jgi:hypothetical protein